MVILKFRKGNSVLSSNNNGDLAVSWSGGKESSLMLDRLQRSGQSVERLLVTISDDFDRVVMHGVRRELILRQSELLGIPVEFLSLPSDCSNQIYENKMKITTQSLVNEGIERMAFGDIHLRDVRDYRESSLESTGLTPIFPLWGESPDTLQKEFLERGFRGRIVCGDPEHLTKDQMGSSYRELTGGDAFEDCDPCGEFGEFHTFVWAGPIFSTSIQLKVGETIERKGFFYTDLTAVK